MKKQVDIQFIAQDGSTWADPIFCGNKECNHYRASNRYELGHCKTRPKLTIDPDKGVFCHSASA